MLPVKVRRLSRNVMSCHWMHSLLALYLIASMMSWPLVGSAGMPK